MQQYLTADKVNGGTAEKQHSLSYQNKPHKANIFALYSGIYDGLREKRENKLQHATDKQAENKLCEKPFVLYQVFPKELQSVFTLYGIALFFVKQIGGFKKQGYAFFFSACACAYPTVAKFFLRVNNMPLTRVCHMHVIAVTFRFFDLVHHHKVVLFPMHNAGQ